MTKIIIENLEPVRRRARRDEIIAGAVIGLLYGAGIGLSAAVVRFAGLLDVPAWAAMGSIIGGALAGALIGATRRCDMRGAAAAIDSHHSLKDRTVTALDLGKRAGDDPLHALQIADAESHLVRLELSDVNRFRRPRHAITALVIAALAVTGGFWPTSNEASAEAATVAAPLDEVLAELPAIEQDLHRMEELAEETENEDLDDLVDELKEVLEELDDPGIELKDALAGMSEMQARIAELMAKLDATAANEFVEQMGRAMDGVQGLEKLGNDLMSGNFEAGADALESLDPKTLDPMTARESGERLKKLAENLGDLTESSALMKELSEAASEFGDALEGLGEIDDLAEAGEGDGW